MNTELFKILPNEILFKILQERKKIKQAERFKKNFNKVVIELKKFKIFTYTTYGEQLNSYENLIAVLNPNLTYLNKCSYGYKIKEFLYWESKGWFLNGKGKIYPKHLKRISAVSWEFKNKHKQLRM